MHDCIGVDGSGIYCCVDGRYDSNVNPASVLIALIQAGFGYAQYRDQLQLANRPMKQQPI